MNNKPHSQKTKDKIRAKLLGRSPSNKGVKRGTPHNKLPTKVVNCECGCGMSFEVRITSIQKYYKGCYQKLISTGGNPCSKQEVKDKISKTLTETYKAHPEILDKISKTLIETYKNKPEILENRKVSGINQYSGAYTSIEKLIADALTLINIDFRHNIKIGRYFPDFVIFEKYSFSVTPKILSATKGKNVEAPIGRSETADANTMVLRTASAAPAKIQLRSLVFSILWTKKAMAIKTIPKINKRV